VYRLFFLDDGIIGFPRVKAVYNNVDTTNREGKKGGGRELRWPRRQWAVVII